MDGIEVSLRFYIRGKNALLRAENLKKRAQEKYHGNLSKMVNECVDKWEQLDPETGERLKVKS